MLLQSKDLQYRGDWRHILTFGVLVRALGSIYIYVRQIPSDWMLLESDSEELKSYRSHVPPRSRR